MLQVGEPTTRKVENAQRDKPHSIHKNQPVAVTWRGVRKDGTMKKPEYRLPEENSHEYGEPVNQIEMQNVEKWGRAQRSGGSSYSSDHGRRPARPTKEE